MPTLNMHGPYDLTYDEINIVITRKSAGNYALGYTDNKNIFRVKYVGRSDTDVALRLKQHVGEKEAYKQFKYSYANSVKEAYEKECKNYHDFGESASLDNERHPDKPEAVNYRCPVCGC